MGVGIETPWAKVKSGNAKGAKGFAKDAKQILG